MKSKGLAAFVAIAALSLAAAASASAAPVWNLDIHHHESHFPPGGTAQYWFDVNNVGDTASSGKTTLTVELPAGLEFSAKMDSGTPADLNIDWNCPDAEPGDTTIVCETSGSIPRHRLSRRLILQVAVAPQASGTLTTTATLTGGGAATAASATEPTPIDSSPAPFGIVEDSFTMDFFEADGLTTVRQAGSHPPLLTSAFDFNTIDMGMLAGNGTPRKRQAESLRNVVVDLPPGFLGNPTAVGECTPAQFAVAQCPPSSQVGRFDAAVFPPTAGAVFNFSTGVFNLTHPPGVLTDLGFLVGGNPVHIRASLDPSRGYAITTTVPNINESLPPFNSKVTIWGVPGDPSHDSERCSSFSPGGTSVGGDTDSECSVGIPERAFLTVPSRCEGANVMRLRDYDSWQDPGDFGPAISRDLDPFTDCDDLPFDPSITLAPTTSSADSPSGLDVTIQLPQNESCEQIAPAPPAGEPQLNCGVATSPLRDATVVLPEGLTVNAASANDLAACSESQIALGTDNPVRCPSGSKVAEVEVITPALPDPVDGVVYLATPYENPFDSLLAGYIVLSQPSRGLLVKIPGRIEADKETGQLTGIFEDNPQLPFSEFDLHFRGGVHSTLVTPKVCGNYTSNAEFRPWSADATVQSRSSFSIGRACAVSESDMPNNPSFDAGSISPIAGAHSPFVVNLSREDGSQRFSEVTVKPPPGLTAKLAGTPYCPEASLAAAGNRDGKAEQAIPSCPQASEIGKVWAAAGAGPSPYWAPGKVYLAGPYKGAPLSMAIITPAVAGPFDLGTIVVRTALQVNEQTAEITAVSDPIPEMLEGIPLNVRRASIRLNKPNFTLNPTSCDPMGVQGQVKSVVGGVAGLFNRFQVGECGRLGFKPRFAARILNKGRKSTLRSFNPRVRFTVRGRDDDANIGRAAVTLPPQVILDQSHIQTTCTRIQFAESRCPEGSIYGYAKAWSPILDEPLEGPVYLASNGGARQLPDLVADLKGQVRITLTGWIDTAKGGRIRNIFPVVPDAPVSKFVLTMRGGKRGLLVNSKDLCRDRRRGVANFRGQNGKRSVTRPRIRTTFRGCKRVLKRQARKRTARKRTKLKAQKQQAAKRRAARR